MSISTSGLAKAEVSLLYRLSKGAYKKATLHLDLPVPQDYCYSSLGPVCATRSDHSIQFKCFSSPYQRFLNSANVWQSLLKVSRSTYNLSKATGKVAL